jgi:isocitrate/isopropylmalate dehydrogenase
MASRSIRFGQWSASTRCCQRVAIVHKEWVFDVEQTSRNTVDEVAWKEVGVSSWIDKMAWEALFGISGI